MARKSESRLPYDSSEILVLRLQKMLGLNLRECRNDILYTLRWSSRLIDRFPMLLFLLLRRQFSPYQQMHNVFEDVLLEQILDGNIPEPYCATVAVTWSESRQQRRYTSYTTDYGLT